MKIRVFAAPLAFLPLFAGSSIALPQELPDAQQATPVDSGNRLLPPPGMGPGPLLPQTFCNKFMVFAVTTVGSRALFVPVFPAAIRMANPLKKYPAAWREGAQASGRNYGDRLATKSAFETGRFAAGAALDEDLRYHPSASTNFFKRTGHAVAFTFVDRSDDGDARPAVANFAGLAAGSYVGMSYLAAWFNDVTHANQRFASRLGGLAASNVFQEFAPDLIRFAMTHNLPRPQLPIPEWWTKR